MATTRKPTTRRPQDNVTALPQKVHFSVLIDDEEPIEPFFVELAEDKIFELSDPTELSVEQLAELRQPLSFLRLTAPDEECLKLLRGLPAKKFGKVMRSYFEHFGIESEPGKSNGLGF